MRVLRTAGAYFNSRRRWRKTTAESSKAPGTEMESAPGGILPARFAALARTVETTAATAALLRLGFVDGQATAFEFALIERGAGRLALSRIRHLDKCEAAGLTGGAITHQAYRFHLSDRGKQLLELLFARFEREISYVQLH